MVEMDTQNRDDDAINAVLFGNDVKEIFDESNVIIPHNGQIKAFESGLVKMINNAKTKEDLSAIGLKLNEAIDNKYNIDVMDYQVKAASKLRNIYTKLGEKI
jgi:hypothetical protein